MIDDSPLVAVRALARLGQFKQAARELGVSTATLSRLVQRAEDQLGMVLFQRNRTGCTLTAEGRAFLPIAERLHGDLSRFRRASDMLRDAEGKTLSIGCGPLPVRPLLVPALSEVLCEIPDMRSRIVVSAEAHPIRQLETGEIDLYIGDLTHTTWIEEIEIHVLRKRKVTFVARPDHPVHQDGPCLIREVLERYPFASPHLHKHWQATLSGALGGTEEAVDRTRRLPQIQSDDYALLTRLGRDSDCVVGGMADSFTESLALGELREVRLKEDIWWNICLARKSGVADPALDLLWRTLQTHDAQNGQAG